MVFTCSDTLLKASLKSLLLVTGNDYLNDILQSSDTINMDAISTDNKLYKPGPLF